MGKDKIDSLYNFLLRETPNENGCMVCETIFENRIKYLLIERFKDKMGNDIFTINGRFYYDYEYMWDCKNQWKVIFKKIVK